MLKSFKLSDGLFSHYARLLCDTVIPFQEAVLNDRVENVAPSHAIDNFRNAAALLRAKGNTSFEEMIGITMA